MQVISDLLKPEKTNLVIREARRRGVYVEGLSEWVVRNPSEVRPSARRHATPHIAWKMYGATTTVHGWEFAGASADAAGSCPEDDRRDQAERDQQPQPRGLHGHH